MSDQYKDVVCARVLKGRSVRMSYSNKHLRKLYNLILVIYLDMNIFLFTNKWHSASLLVNWLFGPQNGLFHGIASGTVIWGLKIDHEYLLSPPSVFHFLKSSLFFYQVYNSEYHLSPPGCSFFFLPQFSGIKEVFLL
jgi:hypothetical protein